MVDKESLRRHFWEVRANISTDKRLAAARQAADIFASHPDIHLFDKIACYFPYKSEFDTRPLIETIWQHQKECFLPVLHDEMLQFVAYEKQTKLTKNRYGINEPVNKRIIPATSLNVVFLPLTAFDKQGHRLGSGGGYYDKTFSFLNDKPERRPLLVGLGFAAQEAPLLPSDSWDIRLDAVLTEDQWITTIS